MRGAPEGATLFFGAVGTFEPSMWGDRTADIYEELAATMELETEPAVELLAELANGGPVLELAIGTGRVALPLAQRGIEVHGIDASEAMVAKLRARPGGDRIPVTIGDFADVDVEVRFRLIFCVAHTFFALYTQEDQVRCFQNVADHLTDDGLFVLELWVPSEKRGDNFSIYALEPDRLEVVFWRHDAFTQIVDSVYLRMSEDGVRLLPSRDRQAPPSELDLMARLAGMHLRDRWGSWRREPFTAKSEEHVSVYAKSPAV